MLPKKPFSFKTAVFIGLICSFCYSANSCYAVDQVEEVANYIYRLSYNQQLPDVTADQLQKIQSLYVVYRQVKSKLDEQLATLKSQLYDGFTLPLPPAETSIAKQEEINRVEDSLDSAAISAGYQIRQCLTPKQLQSISVGDPDSMFRGIKLTDEQKQKMLPILKDYAANKDKLNKKLDQLQYDRVLLMTRANVDEKAVSEKQNQINATQAELNNEELKMQLSLRGVLTAFQRNELYNTHRGNIFGALGLSHEQSMSIMDMHMQREDATIFARRQAIDLGSELMTAYKRPETDEKILVDYQKKIDAIVDQARIKETMYVLSFRKVLTPPQREKLSQLLKLEKEGKLPPLPYPEETCPMHLNPGH